MSSGGNSIWIGLGLVGAALLAPSLGAGGGGSVPRGQPDSRPEALEAKPETPPPASGLAGRVLERDPDGHFYAEAQVNGARILFLIDTGASMVVLTPQDAQRAGIALPSERAIAHGVGGEVEVIPVTIDRIALGGHEARGVRAAIARELPVSLLGQSYLSEIGSVEISGDRMMLR